MCARKNLGNVLPFQQQQLLEWIASNYHINGKPAYKKMLLLQNAAKSKIKM
jgi:hypothetical protein